VRGSDGGGKEEGLQQHPQHQARQEEERGGGRGRTNEGAKSRKKERKDRPKGVSIAAVVLLV